MITNKILEEETYIQKLKNTYNLRLCSFFIWKLFGILFLHFIFTSLSRLEFAKNICSSYFLGFNPFEVNFGKLFIIKIYLITIILDWLKAIYFQKYEENVSKTEYLLKLFFSPNYNTVFLFLNSILSSIFISIMDFTIRNLEYQKKNLHIYRYLSIIFQNKFFELNNLFKQYVDNILNGFFVKLI